MQIANPPLSEKRVQRAGKLVETLKSYTINSIFSANFNRTRNTVLPIATKSGIYDQKTQNLQNHRSSTEKPTQPLPLQAEIKTPRTHRHGIWLRI